MNSPQQIERGQTPAAPMQTTRCFATEYLELCERSKNKEIFIYSVERGSTNAMWIVRWTERRKEQ